MMESATQKRTPLGIKPFWEQPSADPPLKWKNGRCRRIWLFFWISENTITASPTQSERERLARNAQLKVKWENRCQKQMEIGIMSGDKPWIQADCKTVSMLYLSLGTEGRRIICSRNPHLKLDILTTVELWKIMKDTSIRPRNIIFDRYMLLPTKQSKGVY